MGLKDSAFKKRKPNSCQGPPYLLQYAGDVCVAGVYIAMAMAALGIGVGEWHNRGEYLFAVLEGVVWGVGRLQLPLSPVVGAPAV
jgi:hypothetical protein